jgi:hypothetical protein
MKKNTSNLNTSPVKWLIAYTIFITGLSILAASLVPDELGEEENPAISDSLSVSGVSEEQKVKETLSAAVDNSQKKDDTQARIDGLVKKYKAVVFSDLNYLFTYDYQKNLKKKNVLFYLFIEDIYEEKGNLYIKSTKPSSNHLNVMLKIKCNKISSDTLMNYKYFVYMLVKVNSINKVLFDTYASISKEGDGKEALISFDTVNEGLLFQGDCIEVFAE